MLNTPNRNIPCKDKSFLPQYKKNSANNRIFNYFTPLLITTNYTQIIYYRLIIGNSRSIKSLIRGVSI